ncbi:glycosyltransferase family 4 protein [Arthrobacter sp. NIO-1057]|uniref:glycosyltransferase family 4 protein n=1 Tax=Arthrobacter sp. NIO-1057 TaxID=993071 RepID=UPI00159F288B|nr:glycosyltransferase family 4 protein [Arthrobacter sp. NIO-1057]
MLLEDVKGLLRGHWEVIAALPCEGLLASALREQGAKVVVCTTPVLRKSFFTPQGALVFAKDTFHGMRQMHALLKRIRPTTVLVNTTTIPFWLAYARLSGHKVALHVHESESNSPKPMRLGLSLPGTFAHRIITNSRFTNAVYLQHVPWAKKNSQVIYNGIAGPTNPTPARLKISGPLRLLYVGRLSERKGVLVLLDAVKILQLQGVNVSLNLVGAIFEGYEAFENTLKDRVRTLPRPDLVKFLGFHSDVWPHYDSADIAIVPSQLEESFGNTAVEAVLAERPVIASSIGGLKEAIEQYSSAILVEPENPQQLSGAIATILNDWEQYRVSAQQSAVKARELHDPELFGQRINAALSSLLTSG